MASIVHSRTGPIIVTIAALAVGLAAGVIPARGVSAGTPASFILSSGTLSIAQPTTTDFGTKSVGLLSLSGSLGTVTVSDTRGLVSATWTATVSSTNFTTGTATTYETVTDSNIAYSAGAATSVTGQGVFTPGVLTNLSSAGVAGSWVGNGSNTVSWDPTITFTLSPSQVAGTYTGTITHSVA
jgi:hypothetical protein